MAGKYKPIPQRMAELSGNQELSKQVYETIDSLIGSDDMELFEDWLYLVEEKLKAK